MTRCLRIFGAYSFRLTRRHSTLLLITSFIVTLTIVLHLYAYRHHDQPHSGQRLGDYIYKPGAFLKGKQPQNTSYCLFNYGLPKVLKWESFRLYPSPETGSSSFYKIIYDAIKGRAYSNLTKTQAVTYATQATPEFLYHLVEITRFWEGPISIAVYVPNYDLDLTMQVMEHLCHCYSGMLKVSMHLFYPVQHPPRIRTLKEKMLSLIQTTTQPPSNVTIEELFQKRLENYKNLDYSKRAQYIQWVRQNKIKRMMIKMPQQGSMVVGKVPDLKFKDCSGLEPYNFKTFRKENMLMYPINVGRNVARNASKTNYFLVSDIEMIPSYGLAPKFLKMVRKLIGSEKRDSGCVFAKTVFVVPLFEVEKGAEIPHDKKTLVQMWSANRAMYFHQTSCTHCQRFPGLQTWLMRSPRDILEPMLITKREYPYHRWEPLYFGTNKEPWYSETLTWEGRQDKMTQMLELCLQEYRLVILDGGFLCHAAAVSSKHQYKRAVRKNRYNYMKIIRSFKRKYKDIQECRVMFGC